MRWKAGDQGALEELVPLVYKELRDIARHHLQRERPGHTLQSAALVHEAYAVYVPRIGRPPAPMLEDYQALIRDARVHVLEDETGIAGLVVLIPEERVMLLDNVAVKSAAQGAAMAAPSSLSPRRRRAPPATGRSASSPMSA